MAVPSAGRWAAPGADPWLRRPKGVGLTYWPAVPVVPGPGGPGGPGGYGGAEGGGWAWWPGVRGARGRGGRGGRGGGGGGGGPPVIGGVRGVGPPDWYWRGVAAGPAGGRLAADAAGPVLSWGISGHV